MSRSVRSGPVVERPTRRSQVWPSAVRCRPPAPARAGWCRSPARSARARRGAGPGCRSRYPGPVRSDRFPDHRPGQRDGCRAGSEYVVGPHRTRPGVRSRSETSRTRWIRRRAAGRQPARTSRPSRSSRPCATAEAIGVPGSARLTCCSSSVAPSRTAGSASQRGGVAGRPQGRPSSRGPALGARTPRAVPAPRLVVAGARRSSPNRSSRSRSDSGRKLGAAGRDPRRGSAVFPAGLGLRHSGRLAVPILGAMRPGRVQACRSDPSVRRAARPAPRAPPLVPVSITQRVPPKSGWASASP